jgi:hypothetical protein
MAVRDDFSAGEVLAAADLNDTFASKLPYSFGTATPTTTDSGFLWYDSNSTPAVAKYWDGSSFATLVPAPGLELITAETFSAVSSVSINDCFSATYHTYRVILRYANTSLGEMSFRLRLSGSDATTSYNTQEIAANGTGLTGGRRASDGEMFINFMPAGVTSFSAFDLNSPAEAAETLMFCNSVREAGTGIRWQSVTGQHATATAYDGLTLLPAAGTITGTIRIYGYKD